MPAWWNSLETMTAISGHAKTVGFVLGLATALCGAVIFFSGKRVDALKTIKDADRHLTSDQRAKLLTLLAASPIKGEIRVEFVSTSDEAKRFAEEFEAVLTEAGWPAKKIGWIPTFGVNKGLWLIVDDEHNQVGFALYTALKDSGVSIQSDVNSKWPKGAVTLHVALKP